MPIENINAMDDVFSRYKIAEIEICDDRNSRVLQLTATDIDILVSLT